MTKRQLDNLLRMVRLARGNAPPALAQIRASMDRMGEVFGLVDDCRHVPAAADDGAVHGEWLIPERLSGDGCMLCVHGGGFGAGSLQSHRGLYSGLAVESGLRALSVNYRLAPEDPFPAPVEDVTAAAKWLVENSAGDWVAAADSAGATLLLQALGRLGREGLNGPSRLLLMSPWIDLTATSASYGEREDPLVSREGVLRMAERYAGGRDLADPEISPLFAELSGLPDTLIQIGEHEVLFDDGLRLQEQLTALGITAELQVWPGMVHVFQQFAPRVDEGREAIQFAGRYLAGLDFGRPGDAPTGPPLS